MKESPAVFRPARAWPLAAAVLALFAAAPGTAAASDAGCTYVAARTGDDAATGTEAAPFKTVQRLVNALHAGDTGCVRNGTYDETPSGYVARFANAGTTDHPITLRSYPGERAHLVGIVQVVATASAVHVSGLDIEGTGVMNTVKVYAPDVVIEGNDITNVHRGLSCMMLGSNAGAGQALRVVVRRNVMHECGSPANGNKDHAIYAANVLDGQIVENVISDPAAWAIQLYPNAHRTTFAHNVIDAGSSVRGGVIFGGDTDFTSSDNLVEKNVIANAATYGISSDWGGTVGSGNLARQNCIFHPAEGMLNPTGGYVGEGNVAADPKFVDRAHHDLRLSAGSPCLDVVGYDTAALIAGDPAPAPAPAPSPSPAPTVSPAPTATPAPAPAATEAPAVVTSSTVEAPAPDPQAAHVNQAPAVWLTAPVVGASFTRTLRIAAGATDDVRVTRVEFYFDGKRRYVDSTAPYVVTLGMSSTTTRGSHLVTAKAFDESGRSTSASARVVRTEGPARATSARARARR